MASASGGAASFSLSLSVSSALDPSELVSWRRAFDWPWSLGHDPEASIGGCSCGAQRAAAGVTVSATALALAATGAGFLTLSGCGHGARGAGAAANPVAPAMPDPVTPAEALPVADGPLADADP
jgi:hypothetical protein